MRGEGLTPWLSALGLASLVMACGTEEASSQPNSAAVAELNRLVLAPPLTSQSALLLCGRFEVTRGQFYGDGALPEERDLPVVFVSRGEAAQWAEVIQMRLPTRAEWAHLAAAGAKPDPSLYPWGRVFHIGAANTLELGLHRPAAVGSFESGRNALRAYDFGGNVWEWVADDGKNIGPTAAGTAAACGGSYANDRQSAYVTSLRRLAPADRAEDLGFRVVADAEAWMLGRGTDLWSAASTEERAAFRQIFGRWRADLRENLADRLREAEALLELRQALRNPAP